MSLFLGIDTSGEESFVAIYDDTCVLGFKKNKIKNNHTQFLHVAIDELLNELNISPNNIDAFCLINGPGSYTGLRVGLSSIKGLCYALQKPLIAINTLDVLAHIAIPNLQENEFIFSAIDARENEVFGAVYDHEGKYLITPQSLILNSILEKRLLHLNMSLIGNATHKIAKTFLSQYMDIVIYTYEDFKNSFITLSRKSFINKHFSDLTALQPFYLKPAFVKNITKKNL